MNVVERFRYYLVIASSPEINVTIPSEMTMRMAQIYYNLIAHLTRRDEDITNFMLTGEFNH